MESSKANFNRCRKRMKHKCVKEASGKVEDLESFRHGFDKGWKECLEAIERRKNDKI